MQFEQKEASESSLYKATGHVTGYLVQLHIQSMVERFFVSIKTDTTISLNWLFMVQSIESDAYACNIAFSTGDTAKDTQRVDVGTPQQSCINSTSKWQELRLENGM